MPYYQASQHTQTHKHNAALAAAAGQARRRAVPPCTRFPPAPFAVKRPTVQGAPCCCASETGKVTTAQAMHAHGRELVPPWQRLFLIRSPGSGCSPSIPHPALHFALRHATRAAAPSGRQSAPTHRPPATRAARLATPLPGPCGPGRQPLPARQAAPPSTPGTLCLPVCVVTWRALTWREG